MYLLKLVFVLFYCVYLWDYIVGICMYILLVLVLWCLLYLSTLVYDLECQNILLLVIYPTCSQPCCLEVV